VTVPGGDRIVPGPTAGPPCPPGGCEPETHDRDWLLAVYGVPRRVPGPDALALVGRRGDVHPRDVMAHLYRDQAAADGWLGANLARFGHPQLGTAPAGDGVVGVLDLRPELDRHGVAATDPAQRDDWHPGG
jgi:hypothetical protein